METVLFHLIPTVHTKHACMKNVNMETVDSHQITYVRTSIPTVHIQVVDIKNVCMAIAHTENAHIAIVQTDIVQHMDIAQMANVHTKIVNMTIANIQIANMVIVNMVIVNPHRIVV